MNGEAAKTSTGLPDVLTERAVRRLQQQLNNQDREYRLVLESVGAAVGDHRAVTLQVKDKEGNSLAGYFVCRIWFRAFSPWAAPADTLEGFVPTGGSDAFVLQTITAGRDYEIVTDANGRAVMDVEESSAAPPRYMHYLVVGRAEVANVMTAQ